MEMISNGKSGGKLKDRLARMFRRNSCSSNSATSVTLSSGNTSSRTLLSDIARNPFRSLSTLDNRKDPTSGPTTSAAATARVSVDCGPCRLNRDNFVIPKNNPVQVRPLPLAPLKTSTAERRVRKNGLFYSRSAGTGTGASHPVSQSSPVNRLASDSYRICYSLNKHGKTKIKKKKLCNNGYGFSESSCSSLESDGGYGLFSSDDDDKGSAAYHKTETETFFSSKSFSSDSSEFYSKPSQSHNLSNKKRIKNNKTTNNKQRTRRRRVPSGCQNCNIKELGLTFQPNNKPAAKKGGFAVVKKTSDPYADFRNSMVEMIVERQIFGEEDLEKLLHSYLSLNSPRHHPVILQAFSDIWVVLFGN